MSDEQILAPVDQSTAADSYESMYQFDDSGTDEAQNIDKGEETTPAKPATKSQTTPIEGQNVDNDTIDGGETKDLKAPSPLAELKEIPKGFSKLFYSKKEGEEGVQYNRDKMLGYVIPKENSPYQYKYINQRKFAEKSQVVAPTNPEEERQLAAQKHMDYETSVRSNMTMWPDTYRKYIDAGHDSASAEYYANQKVERAITDDLKSREYDRFSEMETKLENKYGTKFETDRQNEEKKSTALSNTNLLINHIAENFDLSPEQAGTEFYNLITEHASGLLNEWFDAMNPDSMAGLTENEYNDSYNAWWRNDIASNQARLNLVYNFALNALNAKMLPHNLEQAVHGETQLQTQNKRGNVRRASSVNRNTALQNNSKMEQIEKYYSGGADNYG